MKNELNLFIVFEAIMRTGSAAKAAESLNMSPPAVSQAINRLRQKFPDPLFVREGRGLKPTAYAEELYKEINGSLSTLVNKLEGFDSSDKFDPMTSHRTFKIAANSDIEILFYDQLINKLAIEAPHVKIETQIKNESDVDIKNELIMRKIDLAITLSKMEELSYNSQKLTDDKLIILAKKDHPRIQNNLTLDMYLKEKHISWNQNESERSQILKNIIVKKIPERNVVYRTSAINMLFLTANTELLCISTESMFNKIQNFDLLNKFELPFECGPFPLFITSHKSYDKDEGLQWLRKQIQDIF